MAELKNELTWSFSRKRTFDSCRRRYYYNHYLKWGGWDSRAPEERRVAYRLSKMTTVDLLSGDLIHKGIEQALRRFRANGMVVERQELVKTALLQWERALAESRSGRWAQDPKRMACLVEDYYRQPDRGMRVEKGREKIETCLANFCASKTWADLRRTRPGGWLAMDSDPFQTSLIDGIPAHGRPDLGYDASKPDAPKSRCWVFDWKSGRPADSDVLQIRFYALYAENQWGFPPEAVRARLIYLYPEVVEDAVEVTPEGLQDARKAMAESFQQMKSVLSDVQNNVPKDISHFHTTTRTHLCRRCQFQEICTDRGEPQREPEPEEPQEWDPFV